MNKKVLGIVGSPRKGGNTDALVGIILDGAKDAGGEIDKIYLADYDIKNCRECLYCHTAQPKVCAIKDDMAEVVRKMAEADVWVLGTPVFWWGPSGTFKTFLDRWYGFDMGFGQKKIIFAYPSGDSNKEVARFLVGMLKEALAYEGTEAFAYVQAAGANDPGDVLKMTDVMQYAKKVGSECVK